MIFDANYTSTSNLSAVKESPYELGLAGAMMHVYENECNYNAIMKAVGLSELKYYQETGKDLFVHEAGAFDGFIAKIKAFFEKVIEKIKSIFKKFVDTFYQYIPTDKQFVKKYGDRLTNKDLKDFKFTGYEFGDFAKVQNSVVTAGGTLGKTICDFILCHDKNFDYGNDNSYDIKYYKDSDDANDMKEEERATVIGQSGKMDETEFKDRLTKLLYGDNNKKTLDNINIKEQLSIIENSKDDIKKVENTQKEIEIGIKDLLKVLDKLPSEIKKQSYSSDNKLTDQQDKRINNIIQDASYEYDICRSKSNDITIAFGMIVQAYKDRNRQAKAICVKALSYKHEAAMVSESSYSDDIFAGVVIR